MAAERELFKLMTDKREVETEFNDLERELSLLKREQVEFETELQYAERVIGQTVSNYHDFTITDKSGETVTEDLILNEDRHEQQLRLRHLEKIKIRLEEFGGSDKDIEKEYREATERDQFLERELTDLKESTSKLNQLITDLKTELNQRFTDGIKKINTEFNQLFALMFNGGSAALELTKLPPKRNQPETEAELIADDEDLKEVTEGIEIRAKLPNKRVKGLTMLSGGERALTSIALIFAISQVNPPLFVILDETDAALDEANSRRYGDMIESLSKHSQLILITHNRETMGRAGILYGVTMGRDGVSKLLSVKFTEAVQVAK